MDADTIRKQLQEVQSELRRIEAVREVLLDLVKGYEGWLRLHDNPPMQPRLIATEGTTKGKRRTTGAISAREAIKRVLQDAHGEPLHSEEIWRRAEMLGARTNAAVPKDVVDLTLVGLRQRFPIQRVAPRTYKWVNGVEPSGGNLISQ